MRRPAYSGCRNLPFADYRGTPFGNNFCKNSFSLAIAGAALIRSYGALCPVHFSTPKNALHGPTASRY